MGIIAWIIVGGLAGWIASMIMGTDERQGLLMDIGVGIIGAIAGGFIMNMFGQPGVSGFNLYSVLVSILGSVVLLFIYKSLRRA